MTRPRFLVVGAGAVGGYFGARLSESGAGVTFSFDLLERRASANTEST